MFSLLTVDDHVWAGGHDGTVKIYSALDGKLLHQITLGERDMELRVYSLLLVGPNVWVGSEDDAKSVTIWNSETFKLQHSIPLHSMVKGLVQVRGDVWGLLPGAQTSTITIWSAKNYSQSVSNVFPDSANSMLAVQNRVWIGTVGKIYVVDANDKSVQDYWAAHSANAMVTALELAGPNVWSCASDGSLHVWRSDTREFLMNVKFATKFSSLRLVGKTIWAGSYSDIVVFNTDTFKQQTSAKLTGAVGDTLRAMTVHAGTNTVWTASFDEKIRTFTSKSEMMKVVAGEGDSLRKSQAREMYESQRKSVRLALPEEVEFEAEKLQDEIKVLRKQVAARDALIGHLQNSLADYQVQSPDQLRSTVSKMVDQLNFFTNYSSDSSGKAN